jgi:hypothetical protein
MHAVRHGLMILTISIGAIALTGCARLGAMSRVDPLTVAVYPGGGHGQDPATSQINCPLVRGVGSYSAGAINLDCFRFPEDLNAAQPRLAYARAVGSERERNRLTALLLKHSDDICVEEMGRLTSNEAAVNASLNILGTAATTTANIVTGNQAQQILTGVGTFAGASRSHLNSSVYRNTMAYAISRAITLERQRLRTAIEARYAQSPANFTVDDAIRSANEYHGVCSFYKGLELVLASVEGDQRSRDLQARRTQVDELEQQIRRYREQMRGLSDEDAGPYRRRIEELLGRIQTLTLAMAPPPLLPDGDPEDQEEEEEAQDARPAENDAQPGEEENGTPG